MKVDSGLDAIPPHRRQSNLFIKHQLEGSDNLDHLSEEDNTCDVEDEEHFLLGGDNFFYNENSGSRHVPIVNYEILEQKKEVNRAIAERVLEYAHEDGSEFRDQEFRIGNIMPTLISYGNPPLTPNGRKLKLNSDL
jgi:hypothetical protein